jgi:methylated-DNA-[protein]-cysteine S-methyltransferase
MNDQELETRLRRELTSASAEPPEELLRGLAERAHEAGLLEVGYAPLETPLGRLLVAGTPAGLVRLAFEGETEADVLAELARRVSPRLLRTARLVDGALRQLDDYFGGRRRAFELALDWRLSAGFRRRVLDATARIPYGRTQSYREVATAAGSPRAVRAAGTALARNPLPIVVPCHRVLRSDGEIGGYRGGSAAKQLLLDLEQATNR